MRQLAMVVAIGMAAFAPADGWTQQRQHEPKSQPSPRQQNTNSANWLMPGCRALVAQRPEDQYRQGMCMGVAITAAEFVACPPDGVTNGQVTRVVAAYIDARPARQHEDFVDLAREALREAWPCRR